jgi:hypothetical protein
MTPARASAVLDGVTPGRRLLVRLGDSVVTARYRSCVGARLHLVRRDGVEFSVVLADVEAVEVVPSNIGMRGRCSAAKRDDDEGDEDK